MSDKEMWWIEYFAFVGIMFAFYCVGRLSLRWDGLRLKDPSPTSNEPGHAVDTAPLSARVRQTREELGSDKQLQPQNFKYAQLINSRQQEIANSPYFQKPEPPQPPKEERCFTLLLV